MSYRIFLNFNSVAIGIFLDVSSDKAMLDKVALRHLHILLGSDKENLTARIQEALMPNQYTQN